MATCNPTLLTGPYDWDPAKSPLAAYHDRLARALAIAKGQGADALLVHGDRAEFGALAYLTGFVPKLGPALAIFPVAGGASLLFSGGPGMVASAKKLSWIAEMHALGTPARDLAALAALRVALWGEAAMTAKLHAGVAAAVGALIPLDQPLDALRRAKSPSEIALLRQASSILAIVTNRLCAALRGETELNAAIVAAERSGYQAGAQDVRIMVSRHPGGAPLPVDDRAGETAALPACVHVAVRHGLYWAQGWSATDAGPSDVANLLKQGRICGIGLSLSEAPFSAAEMAVGDVVVARAANRSAILLVSDSGLVPLP